MPRKARGLGAVELLTAVFDVSEIAEHEIATAPQPEQLEAGTSEQVAGLVRMADSVSAYVHRGAPSKVRWIGVLRCRGCGEAWMQGAGVRGPSGVSTWRRKPICIGCSVTFERPTFAEQVEVLHESPWEPSRRPASEGSEGEGYAGA